MNREPDVAVVVDAMIAIREAQRDWEKTQKAAEESGIDARGINYDQLIATAAVRATLRHIYYAAIEGNVHMHDMVAAKLKMLEEDTM